MCIAVDVHVPLIYINGVLDCARWKQSLRQEFLLKDLLGEHTQKKGSEGSGFGQGKELSNDGASEPSFSLIPQGRLGSTSCTTEMVHLEAGVWPFVHSASRSVAAVLPFLGILEKY